MSIFDHFKHLNLSRDQESSLTMLDDFLNSPVQAFFLKGYAGTGKTTILGGLVKYLQSLKKEFSLMAPTGRAAKVLRDKTGAHATTIHKAIYNFSKIVSINQDSEDDAEHSFHYYFPINEMENNERIIIIDESSMISSKESNHELFTFGTNILLDDLMTYARLKTSKSKIIFVGDPAQLPPVGDNKSLALDGTWFDEKGISYSETEMKQVLRQGNNLILQNATSIREILKMDRRIELKFVFDNSSFIKTATGDIIEKYTNLFPNPEIGDGVVISFSNAQCYQYNSAIREKIFPGQKEIVPGDLVLINNNNYHTYGVELFNGDIVKVISVAQEVVHQSAPVYCDVNGVRVKRIIKIAFREIIIRIPNHPNEIPCYIIDSLLHSINKDLSICEMKALYINFMIRFNEDQKKRKESGDNVYKVGSEEFKQALKTDPFFNALKVKFGYAITCHKAQGGEWDKVFVDYYGRVSLKTDPLRWCYTATTRGINTVFAVNVPQFGKIDKLKFAPTGTIGTIPNDALSLAWVPTSPFHNTNDHKCKSLKYWEILEKLENTSYRIKNVQSLGRFQERYILEKDGLEIKLDGHHKGSGHFIEPFRIVNNVDDGIKKELEAIVNSDFNPVFKINYVPEFDTLADLHSMMQENCNELSIVITNIAKGKQYYISYFLKTDSVCSFIQFYHDKEGRLTTAMPKTYNCTSDSKLLSLIQNLEPHAS